MSCGWPGRLSGAAEARRGVPVPPFGRIHNGDVPLVTAILLATAVFAQPQALYRTTQYQQALQLLKGQTGTDSLKLTAQCWYGLDEFKKATEILEKAITQAPARADLHLWLGRAYGRRAETSNPLFAPRYASKARQNFEKAVELDPNYVEAMNDLFEYYRQAPGFLGGGKDKAEALGKRIAALDRAEGYLAEARLLEDRKDYSGAEDRFRKAIAAAPGNAGRVIDLAKFLSRRGRFPESEEQFEKAEKLAPNAPNLLFERAAAYIEAKRNPAQARALLLRYLKAPLTPDDPPRKEADKMLKALGA